MTGKIEELIDSMLDSEFHPGEVMDVIEGVFLRKMMERLSHNQSQLSHTLGLNRSTVRKRLVHHGIHEPKPHRNVVRYRVSRRPSRTISPSGVDLTLTDFPNRRARP